MRRLYGPQTDVDWSSDEFYYRFDKRPSFVRSSSDTGLKEIWELADEEARTNIGERSRVIVLPTSHNPLALLDRLERDYPQSTAFQSPCTSVGCISKAAGSLTKPWMPTAVKSSNSLSTVWWKRPGPRSCASNMRTSFWGRQVSMLRACLRNSGSPAATPTTWNLLRSPSISRGGRTQSGKTS